MPHSFSTITFESDPTEFERNVREIRDKRQLNGVPLIFPYGGSNKLIIALGVPMPMREKYINMAFGLNFQYQYIHFDNITALSRYYFIKTVSREQRDAELLLRRDERLTFYRSTADMLDAKGLNGHECVLRAICEAAQYPVHEEGLIGEIVHILLTPDYGHSPFEEQDKDWLEAISVYKDAAVAGRQMFTCAYIYNGCPQSDGILELISQLRSE
ncbi:uncharacterized protein [Epargyreus clarus]|uniref:uncharacterized protein n=1 Tax=Epargyreus clarus TaxID=520877 RepID=UPI003C2BACF8